MRKFLLAGAFVLAPFMVAHAGVIDFGLNTQNNTDLGPTHAFTTQGDTITGTYEGPGNSGPGGADLFGKQCFTPGCDESGLGTTADTTGHHEIQEGHGYVQMRIDGLVGKVIGADILFSANSVTAGEHWAVYGTNNANDATGFGANSDVVMDNSTTAAALVASGSTETSITLPDVGTYKYLDFIAVGHDNTGARSNFLIADITANALAAPVPEPASLALFGVGLAGLGFARRRRSV